MLTTTAAAPAKPVRQFLISVSRGNEGNRPENVSGLIKLVTLDFVTDWVVFEEECRLVVILFDGELPQDSEATRVGRNRSTESGVERSTHEGYV